MAYGNRIKSSISSLLMPSGFSLCLSPTFSLFFSFIFFSFFLFFSFKFHQLTSRHSMKEKKTHKILPLFMRIFEQTKSIWKNGDKEKKANRNQNFQLKKAINHFSIKILYQNVADVPFLPSPLSLIPSSSLMLFKLLS